MPEGIRTSEEALGVVAMSYERHGRGTTSAKEYLRRGNEPAARTDEANVSKTKRITVYEVCTIDRHGDVIDVEDYDTLLEAATDFEQGLLPDGNAVAAGVVAHAADWSDEGIDSNHGSKTIATRGDETALRAGGWIK